MRNYLVVKSSLENLETLSNQVDKLLANGYVVAGGLVISGDLVLQAVVLRPEPNVLVSNMIFKDGTDEISSEKSLVQGGPVPKRRGRPTKVQA